MHRWCCSGEKVGGCEQISRVGGGVQQGDVRSGRAEPLIASSSALVSLVEKEKPCEGSRPIEESPEMRNCFRSSRQPDRRHRRSVRCVPCRGRATRRRG